jgi:malate dehydrogenase
MTGRRQGTVAVLGAGQCGRMIAQRLAEADVYERIVLTDTVDGLAEGIALDLNQSRAIAGFETTVEGHRVQPDGGYRAISGADIVVIAAGTFPDPQMPAEQVLMENGRIVGELGEVIARRCPDSVVVVVTNPVDIMTAVAHAATGFSTHRVLGQSVLLDSARFADFAANLLAVQRSAVRAVVLGSHAHDETMIPVLSSATVRGVPLTSLLSEDDLAAVVAGTRRGGADVMRLLGTGSSFYAPSAATARMVRAIHDDDGTVLPVCAHLDGEYGLHKVFIGVPVLLGRSGVCKVIELPLSPDERKALGSAADTMRTDQQHCLWKWRASTSMRRINQSADE